MESLPSIESQRWFPSFHAVAKPIGALCNLDCSYCYYLEKEHLYSTPAQIGMSDATLEKFVRQYISGQCGDDVHFLWQGGEPTLLGLEFYRRAVQLQKQFADGKRIHNALQTNGVLLDDAFCQFLAMENFLVGISVDGPAHLHDGYRRYKGGAVSHSAVMRGWERLQAHGVAFNALVVVHRENSEHPLDVYRFLRDSGAQFIQFIPLVERLAETPDAHSQRLMLPDSLAACHVAPWSVEPKQFGSFLNAIFDEWVARDVGQVYVQLFDVTLENWLGLEPSLCIFRTNCGNAVAVEKNGDVYSCDHFVFPRYRLGNLHELPLADLVESPRQREFGQNKSNSLPRKCRECDVYFACKGECPKNRFAITEDGEPGLNYLCQGYMDFFRHVRPQMDFMANELRRGRAPANVMKAQFEPTKR